MGRSRRIVTLAMLLIAIGGLAASAGAEVVQSGDVRVNFDARITPKALPRDRPAPITVEVSGRISTTDGTQPPALRRLQIGLNKAGRIDPVGLATCPSGALQSTSSEAALEACRAAQVGTGSFVAQLLLGGKPIPVTGSALVFNSVVGGRPGMLIHIYIDQPVRLTLVIPLKVSRPGGKFATTLTTNVPKLAGGSGSITELTLKIGRTFAYHGSRHSYLSAACAAPPGFAGAPFTLARAGFDFAGGRSLHAVLTRSCKVRDGGGAG